MFLPDRLEKALEMRSMKPADLSKASGVSEQLISAIRSGKSKNPKFSTMIDLAEALDVSLDWLGGLKDTPEVEVPPTLSRSEERLIEDYRSSIPGERAKLSDYARERREISEASDVGSWSSSAESA